MARTSLATLDPTVLRLQVAVLALSTHDMHPADGGVLRSWLGASSDEGPGEMQLRREASCASRLCLHLEPGALQQLLVFSYVSI